jgi:purine operon repressor
MISLLDEFQAQLAGIAVLVEAEKAEERLVEDYLSLIKLSDVDLKQKQIRVTKGNFFTNRD